jgi:spectinomycin phosphotransferase
MLQKPDLADERLIERVQEEYGLRFAQVMFLELGGDLGTAVYRAITDGGTAYFCKLRRGTDDTAAQVASFLHGQGVAQIIPPLTTVSAQPSTGLDGFTLTLYPFVEGMSGYDVELSAHQWADFGTALQRIHAVVPPPALTRRLAKEQYSTEWRSRCAIVMTRIDSTPFDDPLSVELQGLLRTKRDMIWRAVRRATGLGRFLASTTVKLVLCHSDIHPGNLLIADDGTLFIVDWDYPMLAPKERDLMFIGGGQGFKPYVADNERQLFFPSYGDVELDPTLLTYYRYERGLTDVTVESERVLSTSLAERERSQSLEILQLYFLPG